MCSTTVPGTSAGSGTAQGAESISVPASTPKVLIGTRPLSAHPTSSSVGLIDASSRAVTGRRNRGYAVRSIDVIDSNPPETSGPRMRAEHVLETELEIALRELPLDRAAPELISELKDRLTSHRSSPATPCSRATSRMCAPVGRSDRQLADEHSIPAGASSLLQNAATAAIARTQRPASAEPRRRRDERISQEQSSRRCRTG